MAPSTNEILHEEIQICGEPEKTDSRTNSADEGSETELLEGRKQKHLIRKIDFHILPLLLIASGLQFVDKISLSLSAVLGLRESVHLEKQEYNWTSSIFYLGYMVACYPIAWCFVKFPLGKLFSIVICSWGAVLTLHAVARDFTSLMIFRAFLGALESPITPGFSLITSMWYTPREHVSRHCVWFAGGAACSLPGCLIAYGALKYHGDLAQWRLLFLLFGVITVTWGVLMWFLLPDSPETAYFLKPSERIFAGLRPRKFQRTSQLKKWDGKQFVETFKDPKSWWFFIFLIVTSIPAGGLTTFGPIIIEDFGFDAPETVLMLMPTNTVILIGIIFVGLIVPRIKNSRLITMAALDLVAMAGVLMVMLIPRQKKWGRLCGVWLIAFVAPTWPLMLSIFASNTAGFTKKSATSIFIFIAYCIGNIIGPQFFLAKEAPHYETAYRGMLSCLTIAIVMVLGLRVYLDQENRRRDKLQGGHISAEDVRKVDVQLDEVLVEIDETDRENKSFRYAL